MLVVASRLVILSEADTRDWSTFTLKCLNQIDSVRALKKAQAEAQNVQLNTYEKISVYVCRVENLVNKRRPANVAEMRNREDVTIFIQRLPFKKKRSSKEDILDHNPTVEEPVISFDILKICIKRKQIPNEMTPKSSIEVKCVESTDRYQHHTRPKLDQQHDPDSRRMSKNL